VKAMAGVLIISLDCEGKWGMADKISARYDYIKEESLLEAYRSLLDAFKCFQISATFAFVGAFTLNNKERVVFQDLLRDTIYNGQNWLRHFRAAVTEDRLDGWFCPEAFDLVKQTDHEIASHGFCHVPFDDPSTPRAALEADIDSAVFVAREKGVDLETFVFPRNTVQHTDLLESRRFLGYRGALKPPNRLWSLGREFNVFCKSHRHSRVGDKISEIPPGYFFNWRSGLRRRIPKFVTVARWRGIIADAVESDGVAHLWLHPHNIIDGPETLDVLRDVLRLAAEYRDKGQLKIATQAEYLRDRLGRS
jgi:peptidoglycan/xylan/chitin deacetylase (PgdA/CDA1 family)